MLIDVKMPMLAQMISSLLSFQVLDSVLLDLYRLLKQVMASEKDEGVRLHAHLALNELEDVMKDAIFPTQKLEKRIRVLDME